MGHAPECVVVGAYSSICTTVWEGRREGEREGGVCALAGRVMVVFVCVLTLAGFQRAAGRKKKN